MPLSFLAGPDDPDEARPEGEQQGRIPQAILNDPEIRALLELAETGIRNDIDIRRFMDLIISLNAKFESRVTPADLTEFQNAVAEIKQGGKLLSPLAAYIDLGDAVSLAADIIGEFRADNIPIRVGDDEPTSVTKRIYPEFVNRMDMPAGEIGVTITPWSSPFTIIHEMAHALPGNRLINLLNENLGNRSVDANMMWEFDLPDLPGEDASLAEIFTQVAGRMFKDELYAGLAEIGLFRFFIRIGAKVPEHVLVAQAILRDEGLAGFVRGGAYLGDNHLIMYNLAAAAQVAEEIKNHPEKMDGKLIGSLPRELVSAMYDKSLEATRRRISTLLASQELRAGLSAIYMDPESVHPLKPAVMRLGALLKTYFGIDLAQSIHRPETQVTVGERRTERPRGNPAWIENRNEAAAQVVKLLRDFFEISAGRLAQLVREGEYNALGSYAFIVQDGELAKYWSMVLTAVEEHVAALKEAVGQGDGSSYALILPLVLQGYREDAERLLPLIQDDALFSTQWVVSLFNGVDAVSRLGDESSVSFWIGILENEVGNNFTRRYQAAIIDTVKHGGRLTPEGEERLQAFLRERSGNFLPSREVFDFLYDLFTEKLFAPTGLKTKDIEDSFDFEAAWRQSNFINEDEAFFKASFPGFSDVRQIADAATRLRERGFTSQAERLDAVAERLLKSVVAFRTGKIRREILSAYQTAKMKYRESDSFHAKVRKLGWSEIQFLPPASALAAELMIIMGLPAQMGGGWGAALKYLGLLPDGFVKTFACYRLSREMDHVTPPADEDLLKLFDIWKRSVETSLKDISDNASVQPDDEGVVMRNLDSEWLASVGDGRFGSRRPGAARKAFLQRQRYAMWSTIPTDAAGALGEFRKNLESFLTAGDVQGLIIAPQFVPTMYDPTQVVEEILFKRDESTKQVYYLLYDPNLVPLKMAMESAPAAPDKQWFERISQQIEEAIALLPPAMRAAYISILIELATKAEIAGNSVMADDLYRHAHETGEGLRRISKETFARLFAYDGFTESQREFDLQARYRRFQATWERESLISFARIISLPDGQNKDHYASEIRAIVENESIFDIVESADYWQAADMVDSSGNNSSLVYDLYNRAIQTRLREQFEATYDFDHDLMVSIDGSNLSVEEKDQLLEELAQVSFERIFHSSTAGFARSRTRDQFLLEMGRMFEPVNALLDLVERRGYVGAERAIWEGLRRLLEALLDEIPAPMHALLLARPALLAIVNHPEIVHPDSRSRVLKLAPELDRLFDSSYIENSHSYPDLPSVWDIKQAYADGKQKSIEANISRILKEIPNDGSFIDPYLLDLLNIDFISEVSSRSSFLEDHEGPHVRPPLDYWEHPIKIFAHFNHRVSIVEFAKKYPDVVRRVFLSHLDRPSARMFTNVLLALATAKDVPKELRLDAFRALERTGYISDYVMTRFEAASASAKGLRKFLDVLQYIFASAREVAAKERDRFLHPPDWLIAPFFEPILAREIEDAKAAMKMRTIVDEDFNLKDDVEKSDITPYSILRTAWSEPDEWFLQRYERDESYFLTRLGEVLSHVVDAVRERYDGLDLGDIDYDTKLRTGYSEDYDDFSEVVFDIEKAAIRAYKRNKIPVRIGSVSVPEAFEKINPVLRFVIADYISLVPASTRMLLLAALYRSQENLGEDEVLSIFFELTGQEKLAQFLSQQEGVLPDSYRMKLQRFQEDLRPSTQQEIVDTLRRNGIIVGEDIKNEGRLIFEHAGTVGELWKGELTDGRQIAIKILPWKKRRRNEESIRALAQLSSDMQLFRKELFGGMNFEDLYARYRETLLAEMDYRAEAVNLKRLAPSMDENGIAYPNIHEEMLRRDVMIMDYIPFENIVDIKSGAERQRLIDRTGRWLAQSIFRDGQFYEDFHPGNIKWMPSGNGGIGRPLILDFGRIGHLTEIQRRSLMDFLVHLTASNVDGVVNSLMAMTYGHQSVQRDELKSGVEKILRSGAQNGSSTVQSLFSLVSEQGASLEPNYLQFIKAVISWENVMKTLDPNVDFSAYAAPVIIEQMAGGGSPSPSPMPSSSPTPTPAQSGGAGASPATHGDTFSASAEVYAEEITGIGDEEITGIEGEGYLEDGAEIFAAEDVEETEIYPEDEIPVDDMFVPSAEMLYPAEAAVPAL